MGGVKGNKEERKNDKLKRIGCKGEGADGEKNENKEETRG